MCSCLRWLELRKWSRRNWNNFARQNVFQCSCNAIHSVVAHWPTRCTHLAPVNSPCVSARTCGLYWWTTPDIRDSHKYPAELGDHSRLTCWHRASNQGRSYWKPELYQMTLPDNCMEILTRNRWAGGDCCVSSEHMAVVRRDVRQI